MKYSEMKARVQIMRRLGFRKIPKLGLWDKKFYFGNNLCGRIIFTNHEVLTIRDLEWAYEYQYKKLKVSNPHS